MTHFTAIGKNFLNLLPSHTVVYNSFGFGGANVPIAPPMATLLGSRIVRSTVSQVSVTRKFSDQHF